jgi:hypothetical protein
VSTARILVTGSRIWTAAATMRATLAHWRAVYPDAVLVHGACRGADLMAAAMWLGWRLPVEPHPADWTGHGRAAGFVRNQQMVAAGADVCLAFIREHSRGAEHTAALAVAAGITTVHIRHDSDGITVTRVDA